jgi:hypothetical protein
LLTIHGAVSKVRNQPHSAGQVGISLAEGVRAVIEHVEPELSSRHRYSLERNPVSSTLLRSVERRICPSQGIGQRFPVVHNCQAKARSHAMQVVHAPYRAWHPSADRINQTLCPLRIRVREHQQKLLTTQSASYILRAYRGTQIVGEATQRYITYGVT